MDRLTASIKPVPPFNFELTAGYHTYFQSRYGTDTMEDGVYRRLHELQQQMEAPRRTELGRNIDPRGGIQ